MDDFRRELAGLRTRLRLQTIVALGALVALAFVMGGADVIATTLFEADAWKVRTKNAGGALTDRIVVTTDADTARIKVTSANVELAQQTTSQLPSGASAGAIAYDSTVNRLKFRNTTAWIDAGASFHEYGFLLSPTTNFAWTNMPSAVTELAANTNLRKKLDLSGYTQFRVTCTQNVAGATGAKLRVQYSTDQTTWNSLEDTTTVADLDVAATGNAKVGSYGNIVAAAKADVFIRIAGLSGNGTADPAWRMIAVHVK